MNEVTMSTSIFIFIQHTLQLLCFGYYYWGTLSDSEERTSSLSYFKSVFALLGIDIFLYPLHSFTYLHLVLANIMHFTFVLLYFRASFKRTVISYLQILFLAILAESISYVIMLRIFGLDAYSALTVYNLRACIGSLLVLMLLFPLLILAVSIKKVRQNRLTITQLTAYLFLSFYQLVLFVFYIKNYPDPTVTTVATGTLIQILNLSLCLLIIFSVNSLTNQTKTQKQVAVLQTILQDELYYYQEIQEELLDMRAVKHDYANQLQTIYAMMDSGTASEKVMGFIDSILADTR